MEDFVQKQVKNSRGYTYQYYVSVTGDRNLPAILLLHGWPDYSGLWEGLAQNLRFLTMPFPIVIPDMLGYGGSSKPTDPAEYSLSNITNDLIDIIDAEGFKKVVSTGHDWGSLIAQRLYNYRPDRVAGLILHNVPYVAPSEDKFDLDAVNGMTEKVFGYPLYAYWYFFTEADAPKILQDNVDRLYEVMHADGEASKDFFCVKDAIKNHLLDSSATKPTLRSYAQDDKLRQAFIDRMKQDGFEGPQCYYRAITSNVSFESDKTLPKERRKVNVPVLYIGAKGDYVCRPEVMSQSVQEGLLPDLEETPLIDAGHWSPYERPREMAELMATWLSKKILAE